VAGTALPPAAWLALQISSDQFDQVLAVEVRNLLDFIWTLSYLCSICFAVPLLFAQVLARVVDCHLILCGRTSPPFVWRSQNTVFDFYTS
jgi:hypothetical protein